MGQVPYESAMTTRADPSGLMALAKRYRINQKTVAKWKGPTTVADLPTGPKEPRSTVLSVVEEADISAPDCGASF